MLSTSQVALSAEDVQKLLNFYKSSFETLSAAQESQSELLKYLATHDAPETRDLVNAVAKTLGVLDH